jgi:hypothetical protein
MPHKVVLFPSWIQDVTDQDPCLGRILKEAAVVRDAAIECGIAERGAPREATSKFEAAEDTFAALRDGRVGPHTDRGWKRAADALRKFTEALDALPARMARRKRASAHHRARP